MTQQPLAGSQPAASAAITVQHVQKDYGGPPVLRDLSLTVEQGAIFGLIGPSGSGKSTLLKLLTGRLIPSAGAVVVLDEQPTAFTVRTRRRLGYMPQSFVLYPDLTVEHNLRFTAGLYGLSGRHTRARIREVLELVELWDARNQAARSISGGMRRRLALAAALVHDPDLVFADEPTANLDPILRAKLWTHFRSLCEAGRTLLVTTQYIDEAEYCDRVGLMFDGVLIAEGHPDALRRQAFGGEIIELTVDTAAPQYLNVLTGVTGVQSAEAPPEKPLRVTVEDADTAIPLLLDTLVRAGAIVHSVAQYHPTFDEVFIRLIERHGEAAAALPRLKTSAAAQEDAHADV